MSPQFIETLTTWLQLIILIGSVTTLAVTVGRTVEKPNKTQDERLDALEKWRELVDTRLEKGDVHLSQVDEDTRVTQKALLALLSHAIDGNDIDSLKDAKHDLEQHLIDK